MYVYIKSSGEKLALTPKKENCMCFANSWQKLKIMLLRILLFYRDICCATFG